MSINPRLVALSPQVMPSTLDIATSAWLKQYGIHLSNTKDTNSPTLHMRSWELDHDLDAKQRPMLRALLNEYRVDIAFLPPQFEPGQFRLLAIDMDSTLINIECIDEIADFAGKKTAVARITEATMRGEITNFSDSLRQRVALLAGVPIAVLEAVYRERLKPNAGATELITQASHLGLHTLLVSGGFTFFTDKLQRALGFNQAHANTLEIQDGCLTGKVLGNIIDGAAKARYLEQACQALNCNKSQAIAIGDGANDLLMMAGTGLSIAYRAKPLVKEKADAAFDRVGLDAALALLR